MPNLFSRLFGRKPQPEPEAEPVHDTTEGEEPLEQDPEPWIGVDLDGTLARSDDWRGLDHIGKPVPLMLERVKLWIEEGYTVKIMTARASKPEYIPAVQKWLKKHGLPDLEVTNEKDFHMIELWDDRAIQVVANTGRHVLRPSALTLPKAPALPNENGSETCYLEERRPTQPPFASKEQPEATDKAADSENKNAQT